MKAKSVLPSPLKSPTIDVQYCVTVWPHHERLPFGGEVNVPPPYAPDTGVADWLRRVVPKDNPLREVKLLPLAAHALLFITAKDVGGRQELSAAHAVMEVRMDTVVVFASYVRR